MKALKARQEKREKTERSAKGNTAVGDLVLKVFRREKEEECEVLWTGCERLLCGN